MSSQRIDKNSTPSKTCINPLCSDPPTQGKRGFCMACYRYQWKYDGAMRKPGQRRGKGRFVPPPKPIDWKELQYGERCECDQGSTAVTVVFIQVGYASKKTRYALCADCLAIEKQNNPAVRA